MEHSDRLRDARWIVLDDSSGAAVAANAEVIEGTGLNVVHVTPERRRQLVCALGGRHGHENVGALLAATPDRDIATQRTLALLAGLALRSQWTLLLDDDMVVTESTARFVAELDNARGGDLIVGPSVIGVADQDAVTRWLRVLERGIATDLLPVLAGAGCDGLGRRWYSAENPLWVAALGEDNPAIPNALGVAGGALAFRLDPANALPFPRGYHEDLNWCLLQRTLAGVEIARSDLSIVHAPPGFGFPDADRLIWESTGAIVHAALREAAADDPSNRAAAVFASARQRASTDETTRLVWLLFARTGASAGDHEILSTLQREVAAVVSWLENADAADLVTAWGDRARALHSTFRALTAPEALATARAIFVPAATAVATG